MSIVRILHLARNDWAKAAPTEKQSTATCIPFQWLNDNMGSAFECWWYREMNCWRGRLFFWLLLKWALAPLLFEGFDWTSFCLRRPFQVKYSDYARGHHRWWMLSHPHRFFHFTLSLFSARDPKLCLAARLICNFGWQPAKNNVSPCLIFGLDTYIG